MLANIYVFLTFILINLINYKTNGYARYMPCNPMDWNRGQRYSFSDPKYGKMGVQGFSSSTKGCKISLVDKSIKNYEPGQQIQFKVTPGKRRKHGDDRFLLSKNNNETIYENNIRQLENESEMEFVFSATSLSDGSQCQSSSYAKTFTATAPSTGNDDWIIRALCGNEEVMYVGELKLSPSDNVPTSPPTSTGTNTFDSQLKLGYTGMVLYYTISNNIMKAQIVAPSQGWIGFGVGRAMIGSTVLIGVDKQYNSGRSAVGVYRLQNQGSKPDTLLADSNSLSKYGISDASFATVNGKSTLSFTLDISKQPSDFKLYDPYGSSIVYAYGTPKYQLHISRGVSTSIKL